MSKLHKTPILEIIMTAKLNAISKLRSLRMAANPFGIKTFFLLLIPVFLFLSCSSSVDSDPDAQIPTITSISGDISTVMNIAKDLSVGVSVSDKGTLSYQWYTAESKIAEGTEISDATGASFTPQTQSVGIFYYYCVITNKLGSSKRSVTSPRITYTVGDSVNAIKPVIARQPENVTSDFSEDFLLSVNAYSPDGGTLSTRR